MNETTKKGTIQIPNLMGKISRTASQTDGVEMYVVCKEAFDEFFGGKIPASILTPYNIYMYCPQIYDTMDNYKDVKGEIFYANDVLHIVPNTDTYHYFYGIKECDAKITQKSIGFTDVFLYGFDIPDKIPESYDLVRALTTIDLGAITPKYSETADITFSSTMWDANGDGKGVMVKDFPVKFERDGDIGRITFEDIKAPAGSDTGGGGGIMSVSFATYAKKFFGTMPLGLSMPFKSNTYIPNSETQSWFKRGVDSKMYFMGMYLLFVIEDDTYQKAKVYFCDLDGSTHEEIGMVGEYTLEFNIYADNDTSIIESGTLKSTQTVKDAVAIIKTEEDDD